MALTWVYHWTLACRFNRKFRERAGERKLEIQHQMFALCKAICSPLADGNAEQCVNLQQ